METGTALPLATPRIHNHPPPDFKRSIGGVADGLDNGRGRVRPALDVGTVWDDRAPLAVISIFSDET